ncbi:MAG: tetrahydromethanopterin S-methyltransferase subunit A [Candidatus Thermoplasmatota archaeon]|jgi:tetrahydromethanopterin S-methyltransferase subunit A|nr:tetrahydromethanopterin S-methyltransferase subunit A [Candidatus Thermoplasmatota archaeon]
MENKYYPWGGDFTACKNDSCVAVVLLQIDYTPPHDVAIYGPLKTENIGIEKIVANLISNPYIRYLVVCGDDIRGHRSGSSLIALHKHGVDEKNRIINAPGAIPYIENLKTEAIKRFQAQIEIIDMIGIKDKKTIDTTIKEKLAKTPGCFGEPYIAIRIKPETTKIDDKRALHARIILNYTGRVKKRGG